MTCCERFVFRFRNRTYGVILKELKNSIRIRGIRFKNALYNNILYSVEKNRERMLFTTAGETVAQDNNVIT